MPIVSYESVAEAARNLEAQGIRASVRKVMAALGGGSPNQITPLLAQYHASKTVLQKPAIPLDPRISDLIINQIQEVAKEAAKVADERAADALADLEVVSEAGCMAETRIQELTHELEEARGKAAQDIASITLERDKAETLAMERQAEIARLQELLGREQAAAEEARIKVAKAQLTIDGQKKDIETKDDSLKSLKQDLDEVRGAKDKAEKDLAVAQALAKVAEQSILDEKQKNIDLQKQVDDLRLARDRVDADLTMEKSKAAAAEASLEEKRAMVEELRGQVAMVSAERDSIRDAYKSQGDIYKQRERDLMGEIEGLKDSLAAERQKRLQDALDQQLRGAAGHKKTASKSGGKMEVVPAPVGA